MALMRTKTDDDRVWQEGAIFTFFERTYTFPKGTQTGGTLRSDMPKIGDIMPGCTAYGLSAPRVVKEPVIQNKDTNLCEVRVTYRAYRPRT